MSDPNLVVDLEALEVKGKKRAAQSERMISEGVDVFDTFVHDDMNIYDPWLEDSGRFEVDPYKNYGRDFVVWLLME